ncbi:MAG: secretin N-terminal domain-containing protein [Thermogutta sp.]
MHTTVKGWISPMVADQRMVRTLGCALVWMLLLRVPLVAENHTFRAFTLQHASPEQVEPVLRSLVSPGTEIVQDSAGRRLLVSGTEVDLQITASILAALDKPQERPAQPPMTAPATPLIKSYAVPAGRLQSLLTSLRGEYAERPDVRITADERTGQLFVLGPQDVQGSVANFIAQSQAGHQPNAVSSSAMAGQNSAQPVANYRRFASPQTPSTSSPSVRLASAVSENNHGLTPPTGSLTSEEVPLTLRAAQFEAALRSMLGGAIELINGSVQAPRAEYQMVLHTGETLRFTVDRTTNRVRIAGPMWSLVPARQLVQALDTGSSGLGQTVRVIPLSNAPSSSVQLAAQAIQAANNTQSEIQNRLPQGLLVTQPEPGQSSEEIMPTQPPMPEQQPPMVAPQPQPAGQLPGEQPPAPKEAAPGEASTAEGGGLVGPVQIEFLEGLDVLVVRGNRRDVERVMQIIRQIEEMSLETEPEIRVATLRHVDCEALLAIVTQVYQSVYAARRGSITMIALVKPNAILLAGRQEAVNTALELIAKLDRPVAPETEFKVFPLRHASATTVEQRLTTFYANRGGLGTKILITSDFRSNSIIIKASRRDLLEVEQLIAKLDTPTTEAINEIKVFKLKNSLASELAPILQQAISAQAAGALRQTVTGQVTVQAAAQTQQEIRSTRLRFVTVDTEGKQLLESGIMTDVRITADTRANALVVAAPADSMPLIEALIAELDRLPSAEAQVKVFTIINSDAQSLANMLQTLFGQAITTGADATQPAFRTGAQEGESSLIPLRFAVDVRTNSIIASGSAGDLAVVEAILLRLDESEVIKRRTQVFRLKNAPANDVATAINSYLTNERQVRQLNINVFSTFEFLSKEVVIVPEAVSNSLIVSATPEYFDQIVEIITQLDERPPMVLIQVLIAEVQLSSTDEFGIELGIQDPILFDRSVAGVPGFLFNSTGPLGNNTSTPSTDVVGAQAISNFGVGRGNSSLGFGGMVLSASSDAVSVLIRALKQKRRLDVLSRPQVMALDNQVAFIQVGQQVPTVTGTSVTQYAQVNSVAYTNTGLILLVRPRISPDGQVVMEINAEKSDVGPESEGIPISISAGGQVIRSPRINTTRAQTTISAGDGQTVILGGLITKSRSTTNRRIPGLSDVPILRHLFRYDIDDGTRTELLIFLTPHVVRTDEDVERARQIEAARMHWCLADVVAFQEDLAPATTPRSPTPAGPSMPLQSPAPSNQEIMPTPTPMPPVLNGQSSQSPSAAQYESDYVLRQPVYFESPKNSPTEAQPGSDMGISTVSDQPGGNGTPGVDQRVPLSLPASNPATTTTR